MEKHGLYAPDCCCREQLLPGTDAAVRRVVSLGGEVVPLFPPPFGSPDDGARASGAAEGSEAAAARSCEVAWLVDLMAMFVRGAHCLQLTPAAPTVCCS